MNKFIKVLMISFLLSLPLFVLAQPSAPQPTEYKLLAPITQLLSPGSEKTTAATYIPGLVKFIIALAGVLAVLRIIWGGFQYMSTDAFSGKSEAKSTIQNALWGLLLAMSAWLILYTINPQLVTLDLRVIKPIEPVVSSLPGAGPTKPDGSTVSGKVRPGYSLTPAQIEENTQIRQRLLGNNPSVKVNNGPCATGGTTGCTNLVGLPEKTLVGVMDLASSCQIRMGSDCNVRISGGTEGGHVTHGPGINNVDIWKTLTLDNYIRRNGPAVNTDRCSKLGTQYSINGAIYVDESDHWHVCY